MAMAVRIASCVVEVIHRAAQAVAPEEACGLLFGSERSIERVVETANRAPDPARHFEIDPATLIAALRAERAGGEALAGYWHSHPSGDTRPSATDAAMAAPDGRLWLIAAGGRLAAWRATGDSPATRFVPVVLAIE